MGEDLLQSAATGVTDLVFAVAAVLLPPTIMLLILRRIMPMLGNPLWQLWVQLLTWLIVGPIRLIRLLVREAVGRRRRR